MIDIKVILYKNGFVYIYGVRTVGNFNSKYLKMNIQLTAGQQQQLLELYQTLQSDTVTIQMSSTQISVQTSQGLSTIGVPNMEQIKMKMNRYINDACYPDIDVDAEILAANDLLKLLKLGINPDKTYSQQVLALSYAWEKISQRKACENISLVKIRQEMRSLLNRDTKRLFEIAQRANKLLKTVGDFPPPKFYLITPHWLYTLSAIDFERFITKCREEKNIGHLAGARN